MHDARPRQELLERDAVLHALAERLHAASPGVVLIEAAAGMGKSSVLAAFAAELASGRRAPSGAPAWRVVRATGEPSTLQWPLGVIADAAGQLGPSAARAIVAPPGTEPADAAAAREHAALRLLREAGAATPLVVLLDDLHWADEPSLRVLARAASEPSAGLAVVGALRPADRGSQAARLTAASTVLRLEPLSAPAVAQLLEQRVGEGASAGELAAQAAAATGGNPLLVTELAAALRSGEAPAADGTERAEPALMALPPQAAGRLIERLVSTGSGAHRLAAAVAVLGRDATLARAARLADLDLADAAVLADRLAALDVLAAGATVAVAHPLVAQAVLNALGTHERALLRSRAAGVLRADGAPAARGAALLLDATPTGDPDAAATLASAGREALAAGAAHAAVQLLERAAAEPPAPAERAGVLMALGDARSAAGVPDADEAYLQALALLPDDPVERAGAHLTRAHGLLRLGQFSAAATAARAAIAGLPGDVDEAVARDLRATADLIGTFDLAPMEMADWVLSVEPPNGPLTAAERRRYAHAALGGALTMTVDHRGARTLCDWALDGGALLHDPLAGGAVVSLVTGALYACGDFATSIDASTESIALATARGAMHEVAVLRYLRGVALLAAGQVEAALADGDAAVAGLDPTTGWAVGALSVRVHALLELGEVDAALAAVDAAQPGEHVPAIARQVLLLTHARALLSAGDAAAALAAAEIAGELTPESHANPGMAISQWRPVAATALVALGRPDEAAALATVDVESARRWGAPHAVVAPLVALGLAVGGEEGLTHLAEAAACGGAGQHLGLRIEALTALGAAQRRAGQRTNARETLYAARGEAHAARHLRLLAFIEDELAAAGARVSRVPAGSEDDLTASELRVARLAADGASNRVIAATLFVSVKTVEYHLRNAYRKLDITSRAELTAALPPT